MMIDVKQHHQEAHAVHAELVLDAERRDQRQLLVKLKARRLALVGHVDRDRQHEAEPGADDGEPPHEEGAVACREHDQHGGHEGQPGDDGENRPAGHSKLPECGRRCFGGWASSRKRPLESLSATYFSWAVGPLRASDLWSHCPRPTSVGRLGLFAQATFGVTVRDLLQLGGWASSRKRPLESLSATYFSWAVGPLRASAHRSATATVRVQWREAHHPSQ